MSHDVRRYPRGPHADSLVARILAGGEAGTLGYDLLQELRVGSSVKHVAPLLQSADLGAVRTGAWILSELGRSGRPLAGDLSRLFAWDDLEVRVYALEAMMVLSSECDDALVARAVECVDDRDPIVRKHAIRLIGVLPDVVLARAAAAIDEGPIKDGVEWLLAAGSLDAAVSSVSSRGIADALESGEPIRRRFGAAASLRFAVSDIGPLQRAARSDDLDIRGFAALELKVLDPP